MPVFFRFLLWLITGCFLGFLVYLVLFGAASLTQTTLEIQLHNTFFVLTPLQGLGILSLLMTLLATTLQLSTSTLRPQAAAWLAAVAVVLLIAVSSQIVEVLAKAESATWFSYAAGFENQVASSSPVPSPTGSLISRLLTSLKVIQIALAVVAVFIGVRLGRSYARLK